jgi:oligosaccharide repeat unit polymerase
MRLTKQSLSPAILFFVTWSFAHVAAYLGPSQSVFRIHNVPEVTFTPEGTLWVIAAMFVFFIGVFTANQKQIVPRLWTPSKEFDDADWSHWKVSVGLTPFYIISASIGLLLIYWTALAVIEVGSLSSFIELTYRRWHAVRRLWPDQKPFVGARLLYAALISVVIFATSGISLTRKLQSNKDLDADYIRWALLLLTGILPVMILPILISQRILLATALIAAIVVYTLISPDGISLRYPTFGFLVGFGVWTSQEVVRAGFSTGSVVNSIVYSVNKLLFYFTNDIGNLHRGLTLASEKTFGFLSFNFIFQYLFIEGKIRDLYFDDFYSNLGSYKGGGTLTALGTPFVDFGAFGLILLFIWGYVAQVMYLRSSQSVLCAQIYGLIAASIILSWHAAIWSIPFFWLNIALLIIFGAYFPTIQLQRYRSSKSTPSCE